MERGGLAPLLFRELAGKRVGGRLSVHFRLPFRGTRNVSGLNSSRARVVLHNVSWETYERILADQISSRSPRFTFDRGELEIMSP